MGNDIHDARTINSLASRGNSQQRTAETASYVQRLCGAELAQCAERHENGGHARPGQETGHMQDAGGEGGLTAGNLYYMGGQGVHGGSGPSIRITSMKVTGIRHDDTKEMTKEKQANQPFDQWLIELGVVRTQHS